MASMLLYQSNMANSLRKIQELLQGNAKTQIEGVDKIVRQFMTQMSETMETDFGKLGRALERSGETQSACAENFLQMTGSMQKMLESCNVFRDSLEASMEKQKKLEERLSDTCEQIGNELYALYQTRDMYEE